MEASIGAERIARNAVYFWPDWRDGTARFLKDAGFDLIYAGNFVDQGFYGTQDEVNDLTWIFPGDLAGKSMIFCAEQAPEADAIVVNGMPNWRRPDGLPERTLHRAAALEAQLGKPIVSSDFALYWNIFRSLGVAPVGELPRLLSSLRGGGPAVRAGGGG